MKKFDEFLAKYYPEGNRIDAFVMYGYTVAQTMVQTLKQAGDNLTRENIMKEAANLKNLEHDTLAAGHQDQHRADQLRADQPVPAAALQGRDLGAVRRRCSAPR